MSSDLSLTPSGTGLPNTTGFLAGGFLTAQVVAPDAGVEAARAALERAFNFPSVNPPPPTTLGARAAQLLGNIAKLGLAFVAGRYLTSEGELNLAKDLGQIGRSVTMRDMEDASAAMEAMGWTGVGMGEGWSADQRTRFIEGAAELQRLRAGGTIGSDTFSRAMNDLFQGVAQAGNAGGPVYGPPLPSEDTTVTFPTPAPAPTPAPTPSPSAPPLVGPAPAPRFDGDELAARILEFLPRSGPNLPEIYGTNGGDAAKRDAAAWNRQSDTTVAVALNVRYWDPHTRQQADTWVVYRGVDPSAAQNLARNIDETAQMNVTNRDTALADSGLSTAGLLDRAGDMAFLGSIPSVGGRRMEPVLNEAGYVSARDIIRANNATDLAAGKVDEIDLIIPGDGDRAAFLQDITRGQAAALLNAFRDSGLLRDGVTLEGVIAANGLGSVLDTDAQGRAVVIPAPTPGAGTSDGAPDAAPVPTPPPSRPPAAPPLAPVSPVPGLAGPGEVQALQSPEELQRRIEKGLSPEEQEFWREYADANPDIVTLIGEAGHDADDGSMADAARALIRGAYGQDVVAWLRAGGRGGDMVPPGGRIPGVAGAPAPDPDEVSRMADFVNALTPEQLARIPIGVRDVLHANLEYALERGVVSDPDVRIASGAALGKLERAGITDLGVIDEIEGSAPFTEVRERYTASVSLKGGGSVSIWVQRGGRRQLDSLELARNAAALTEVIGRIDPSQPQDSLDRINQAVQQLSQQLGVPLGFNASIDFGVPTLFSVPGTVGEFIWGQRTEEYVEFGNIERLLQTGALVREPGAGRLGGDRLRLNTFVDQTTGQTRLAEDLTISIGQRNDVSLSSNLFGALIGWIPGIGPGVEEAIEQGASALGSAARTTEWSVTLPAGTALDPGFAQSLERGLNTWRYRSLWNDVDSVIARTAVQIPFYGSNRLVVDGQRLPEGMNSLTELIPPSGVDDFQTFSSFGFRGGLAGASIATRRVQIDVSSSKPIPANQPLLDPGIYSRLDFRELARPDTIARPDGSIATELVTRTELRAGAPWTDGLVGIAGTSRQVVLALPADLVPVLNGREAIDLDQLEQMRDWLKTVQLLGSQADSRSATVLLERFDAIAPGDIVPEGVRWTLIDFIGARAQPLPPMPGAEPPRVADTNLAQGPQEVQMPQWIQQATLDGAPVPEGGAEEIAFILRQGRIGLTQMQVDAIDRFEREVLPGIVDGEPLTREQRNALYDLMRFILP